jgi:hypothetical protein
MVEYSYDEALDLLKTNQSNAIERLVSIIIPNVFSLMTNRQEGDSDMKL